MLRTIDKSLCTTYLMLDAHAATKNENMPDIYLGKCQTFVTKIQSPICPMTCVVYLMICPVYLKRELFCLMTGSIRVMSAVRGLSDDMSDLFGYSLYN